MIIYWASANHHEAEFTAPDAFDLDRPANRHIAFGTGPHRCVGSNLARMNLRVALDEVVRRLGDLKLQPGADVGFHSTFNRPRCPCRSPSSRPQGRLATGPAYGGEPRVTGAVAGLKLANIHVSVVTLN